MAKQTAMNKILKVALCVLILHNNIQSQNYSFDENIHFQIENQEILLSSKQVKFAKKLESYNIINTDEYSYKIKAKKIEGSPIIDTTRQVKNHILLESKDIVIFKFKKNAIKDVNGADIYIFAENFLGEMNISVSKKGEKWKDVGNVTASKRYINLSEKIPFREKYSYIKIKNISKEQSKIELNQVAVIKSNDGELGLKAKIVGGKIYTILDEG